MARQRKTGTAPSAEEMKNVVGETPSHKKPGAPVPPTPDTRERSLAPETKVKDVAALAGDEAARNGRPVSPATGGFTDYVIGAGVLVAQMVLTLKFLTRTRT